MLLEKLTDIDIGHGLIAVMFGPPGVGKTLTVEAGKQRAALATARFTPVLKFRSGRAY